MQDATILSCRCEYDCLFLFVHQGAVVYFTLLFINRQFPLGGFAIVCKEHLSFFLQPCKGAHFTMIVFVAGAIGIQCKLHGHIILFGGIGAGNITGSLEGRRFFVFSTAFFLFFIVVATSAQQQGLT